MSFLAEALDASRSPLDERFRAATMNEVRTVLARESVNENGFAALLSPAADACLESMARRAHELTLRHFGRTISLFTPLYVSNHCANHCRYCGFAAPNEIPRAKLSLD